MWEFSLGCAIRDWLCHKIEIHRKKFVEAGTLSLLLPSYLCIQRTKIQSCNHQSLNDKILRVRKLFLGLPTGWLVGSGGNPKHLARLLYETPCLRDRKIVQCTSLLFKRGPTREANLRHRSRACKKVQIFLVKIQYWKADIWRSYEMLFCVSVHLDIGIGRQRHQPLQGLLKIFKNIPWNSRRKGLNKKSRRFCLWLLLHAYT